MFQGWWYHVPPRPLIPLFQLPDLIFYISALRDLDNLCLRRRARPNGLRESRERANVTRTATLRRPGIFVVQPLFTGTMSDLLF
jgi:hypothetical protein